MDFEKLTRNEVLRVQRYIPGKPVEELQRERGLAEVVKLASNENPYGPGQGVLKVLEEGIGHLNRYPDDSAYYLHRNLARYLEVSERRIFIGNGSVEILYFLATLFVEQGDNLVYAMPSFVIYDIVSKLSLGEGIVVPTDDEFRHDLGRMREAVNERTKLVFICNPNNPTGTYNSESELREFMESIPENVLVVVDEAYYEYVQAPDYPQTIEWLDRYPNLILLRTFSKIHSLAGLRIGYSISHPELVGLLERVRPPFNVNSLSQMAADASLKEIDHLRMVARENSLGRNYITKKLTNLGCRVLPSQTNFVMAFLPLDAKVAYEKLLDMGVIVRPMGNFGTDMNAIRISIGLEEENNRLVHAVEDLLKNNN
ncbi:MAG: histidinol-phosphate transaminase [bacterium]|nr:histidinol-phosphate transaminase [bacterium]